jgi:hypothetical protein
MNPRWMPVLCAAGLLVAASQAAAQTPRPTYKCTDAKGKAVYSQVPCAESPQVLNEPKPKQDARKEKPPQDRARAANRARLTPEELQKCDALAVTIKTQEAELKALPAPVAPEAERPLTQSKKEYREMRCA